MGPWETFFISNNYNNKVLLLIKTCEFMMATGYKTIMFLTTDLSEKYILIVVLSVKRLFNKTFTVITE